MAITDSSYPSHAQPAFSVYDGTSPAPLARLAALHVEAEEINRLAGLLGRSVPAAATLVVMGAATFLLGGGSGDLGRNFAWSALVLIGICAVLIVYMRAIRAPMAREPLRSFAGDLTAALLYTGFAWGAGAFLVLPANTGILGALLFACAPALAMALWLRARDCVLAFLAPVAVLSSFAAGLNPRPGAILEAAFILAALCIVALAGFLTAQRAAIPRVPH